LRQKKRRKITPGYRRAVEAVNDFHCEPLMDL
jgi:hypothetical protein